MSKLKYDIVVVGAGNAALCAAIAAAEQSVSVLVLERAPKQARGGNSYFTDGAIRFAYKNLDQIREILPELTETRAAQCDLGSYTEENYLETLINLTQGKIDRDLAQTLVSSSYQTIQWMHQQGVKFALLDRNQAFKSEGRYHFWGGLILKAVGRGVGLIESLFARALDLGIEVWYETRAIGLIKNTQGQISGIKIKRGQKTFTLETAAVILASGGFEANTLMRKSYLGPLWEKVVVRGTRYNTGDGIQIAKQVGAQPFGDWSGCHAITTDSHATAYGDFTLPGDIFKKHSYPLGIIVNKNGLRFVDEGADFRNYTYAKLGREVLKQPDRIAYQIFDNQVSSHLRPEYFLPQATRFQADSLQELGQQISIDTLIFLATIRSYNQAVCEGNYNPSILDRKKTRGISPPKSNWALKIEVPPFYAFPVICGITFTYGGLKVNRNAQVLDRQDRVIRGLYAAGELVGGLFYHNYPGGAGLMAGATFGKIAGENAAATIQHSPINLSNN